MRLCPLRRQKLLRRLLKKDLKGIKDRLDYSEYGGAGLFGLRAPVIKAHGSSKSRAVTNAVKQAVYMVDNNVTATIQETIEMMNNEEEK